MIVHTFGSKEDILSKLIAAALVPESDFLRVFEKFAERLSGRDLVAPVVNLTFQLAIHDVASLPGAVPVLGGMLNIEFDDLMGGLLADAPEFLQEVIAFHDLVMNDVRGE